MIDTFYNRLFYIFPIFWWNIQQDYSKGNNDQIETIQHVIDRYVSILWLFHYRISLLSWVSNLVILPETNQIRDLTTWWYIFPLVYFTNNMDHYNVKLLFIPTMDHYRMLAFKPFIYISLP